MLLGCLQQALAGFPASPVLTMYIPIDVNFCNFNCSRRIQLLLIIISKGKVEYQHFFIYRKFENKQLFRNPLIRVKATVICGFPVSKK